MSGEKDTVRTKGDVTMKNSVDTTYDQMLDDLIKLTGELNEETDRGVALVGMAFLEDALEDLLRAFFVKEPKGIANGFLGNRAFYSNIELSYCLGLIGPDIRQDLHAIRLIRNEFAHSHKHINFDSTEVNSKCDSLKARQADQTIKQSRRHQFIGAVSKIKVYLVRFEMGVKPTRVGRDYGFMEKQGAEKEKEDDEG